MPNFLIDSGSFTSYVTGSVSGLEWFSIILSVESNLHLLWFFITTLCDWLTKLAPLFKPMGNQIKTNRVLQQNKVGVLILCNEQPTTSIFNFNNSSFILITKLSVPDNSDFISMPGVVSVSQTLSC